MEKAIFIPARTFEADECFLLSSSPEDLLRLEGRIASISARIVKTPSELLDQEILSALKELFQLPGIDRGGLLEVVENSDLVRVAYAWYADGVETVSGEINLADLYPWSYQQLVGEGNIVAISNIDQLPEEAGLDLQAFVHLKVKSSLTIPLFTTERVHHLLAVHSLEREMAWDTGLIARLRLAGEIFVSALHRREMVHDLQISQRRLDLAAASAGVGLWEFNIHTGRVWASAKTRELFDFSADEPLGVGSFLEKVHPEDRDLLEAEVNRSLHQARELHIEYRLVDTGGGIRWMHSRGQLQLEPDPDRPRLMGVTLEITRRKRMEQNVSDQLREIERLRRELETENALLKEEVGKSVDRNHPLGGSRAMCEVMEKIELVAATGSTVLIQGETGTGKELIAKTIHKLSDRGGRLMVTVNCAALPAALVESELFGRERGAFTGAVSKQVGRFELAHNSTLFLDEVSEMPLEAQAKLLRVLQEGLFERLGSPKSVRVNVRIIAATNRNLLEEVESGRFRSDLFYRLNIFPLHVPPLRERTEDIPQLVWKFVNEFGRQMGKRINRVRGRDMEKLMGYAWPGNIRELRNVIEHALIVSRGDVLELSLQHLQGASERNGSLPATLAEVESNHIQTVLHLTQGRIKGSGGAAQLLGLNPSTLYSRMHKLKIFPHRA